MPYTAVPNSGQTLGQTRDQIRNNIQSLKDSLAENHVDLDNGADTGKHVMTNFVQVSLAADKPTTSATEVALYNDVATTGQIWLCPPNTTLGDKKVQLTAGDVTDTKFATNTAYAANLNGGWTFLPGNMLLQYGSFNPNTITAITFPLAFSVAPYSVVLTGEAGNNTTFRANISKGTLTASGFTFEGTISSNFTPVYWTAIGPA